MTDGRPPRPRDAAATRATLLSAAHDEFREKGFDRATTREIAQAAGIDARLITRYFGSKENLFAAVVDAMSQDSLRLGPGHNRAAAQALLSDLSPDSLVLSLRSASNERAAEILRRNLEENYQAQLADSLGGVDAAERAALLIAICAGVQLMRNVIGNSALAQIDTSRIAGYIEAALDSVTFAADGPAAPGSR